MKAQKGWSCFVFFLLHMTHVTWTQRFQIVGPSSAVLVFAGEDVTLPASLSPVISAQVFEVRWFRDNFDSPVLLYQNLQIRPEHQIQAYKGRTALFTDQLLKGNVSLRLQNAHVSDSGLYRCYVDSGWWDDRTLITLNVEVVGSQPSISISTAEDQQNRLECSSEKWSSRPEVTWRDMNGIDVTSQSTLTVQRDDEGLLRVSSVIPIRWEFNVFSCLMRSNTTRPAYQSKMGVYVFSPNISGWSVVFWLLMALCVTATVLLILKWRRMRDKKATYKTKVDILPIWILRKEIEMAQHPALALKFSKVINGFSHEDLLKITEYYKPQLAYVMNFDISSVLHTLISKGTLTKKKAKVVKVKEESEGTLGVESFIVDVMKKDRAVLVSLWEALAEEFVRCPSPNLKGILDEVTEQGPYLLKKIQASAQSPQLELQIKNLHEAHRLIVSESTRPLHDQRTSGDPLTSVVGLETQYTELMVIKQDIKDELTNDGKTQERLVEEGATKNCERVWTEQLFKTRSESKTPPKIIMVSGVAGIGKTTMVQKIISEWARGTQYQRFAFVFLFTFRELNLLENDAQMSLTALIVRHYKHLTHDKLIEILQKPESLLFILDGLEEYKHKLDFTGSQLCSDPDDEVPVHILVTSLVSQTLLKGCSILITSRPQALESMDMERVDEFVEIVGFFPEQKLMYFKKFFGDADVGTKGFQCMKGNTILYSMCASPSYCWIICSALQSHLMTPEEERGAAPRTVTEIFVMFLHNILTNHRQEDEDQRRILISLGKMAYYGVDNRTHVFNEKQEMSTFGIQPVLSSSFLSGFLHKQSTQEHTMYTFNQFTLQEFMAACSFYLDPSGGVEELLKKRDSCKGGRFEIVTRFLAGLAWCPVLKTVEGILGEFERMTTQRIQEWVRQKAKQALRGGDKREALRVCHLICETQNEKVIRDAIGKNLKMNFRSITLYPLDCTVLASVISCSGELKELDLSYTPLTLECIRRLAKGLSCCSEVWLQSCGLTTRCCSALSSALSAPNSRLTELWLNENNNLEDSGVEQLCEGLRSPNCKLETLGLVSCCLTARCCSALSLALSVPNSQLTDLWLNKNNMDDSGMEQLCEGLRSANCKVKKLSLVSCRLTTRCCSALFSALSAPNSWLTDLSLGCNNMEDSGVEQLCEGIRSPNCKLEKLELISCGLTSACSSALSSVLSSPNSRLTYLNLNINNLGGSGARQLSEGLRSDNCKLETLVLLSNGISEIEKRNLRSVEEELSRSGWQLTIYT
ncbi:NACHT, LRR and PYD domains-containing protein 3-like isoform X2 [Polypterus senegalus]|uniref:NACHT, LRR and PYD domains-containing protein 3-like isoform X2 n=1 Tax=Polypterus senegalus TaxID=55291 RepID=UPI001962E747|nr:NACHT, LRR and PYD domains-containing protein 3-like isoform X2 [Polypterus senegalus]